MNVLKRYFQTADITQKELASLVGTTPAAVCRWVNDVTNPSAERAIKIAEVTEGEVKASDILPHIRWEWAE